MEQPGWGRSRQLVIIQILNEQLKLEQKQA